MPAAFLPEYIVRRVFVAAKAFSSPARSEVGLAFIQLGISLKASSIMPPMRSDAPVS